MSLLAIYINQVQLAPDYGVSSRQAECERAKEIRRNPTHPNARPKNERLEQGNANRRAIIALVREAPGLRKFEIRTRLGLGHDAAKFHVDNLVKKGTLEARGKPARYYMSAAE